MSKLKPCPFCKDGGEIEPYHNYLDLWQYNCRKCGCMTGMHDSEEKARKAWNTRYERTCNIEQSGYATGFCSSCKAEIIGSVVNNEPPDYVEQVHYCPACGARIING